MSDRDFSVVEAKLAGLLDASPSLLTPLDTEDAREFIDAGEYGIALDLIVDAIVEDQILISNTVFESIRELGSLMEYDLTVIDQKLKRFVA